MRKHLKRSSPLEETLWLQLCAAGLKTRCRREYKWAAHIGRKFRSDFAIPDSKLLIECEGGLFMKRGGHNSFAGVTRDCEKGNLAIQCGYRMLRFTREMINSGSALTAIMQAIEYQEMKEESR